MNEYEPTMIAKVFAAFVSIPVLSIIERKLLFF